jgi:glycosyltransferase involved in cell wall biosynthesis
MPARNEGPRLGAVLEALRSALPDAPVLVVDGGSTDDTAAVARRAGARVISQDQPGYAGALVAGYRSLLADGHRRVLTLDADGQHPPAAARELVLRSAEGWDWVVASRQGTKSPTALRNRLAHAVLAEAVRLRSGWRPGDPTSGYHVAQDGLLESIPDWLQSGVADANLRACAGRAGFRVLEMPVRMASRDGGASMHAGLRGWRNGLRSLRAVAAAAKVVDRERAR